MVHRQREVAAGQRLRRELQRRRTRRAEGGDELLRESSRRATDYQHLIAGDVGTGRDSTDLPVDGARLRSVPGTDCVRRRDRQPPLWSAASALAQS